uniref:class C sortase n=1 Tax=Eubacterium cellulosolvens TaxID=29322 RepID=UPI000B17BC76|nr:class C sortase [[Eubacterium] cellulosolvens]
MKAHKNKRAGKKKDRFNIILIFIVLGGLGLLIYPAFSDYWNSMHSSRAVADYQKTVESLDQKEKEELLEKAEAYNASLLSMQNRYDMSEEEKKEYKELLSVDDSGMIGSIYIAKINLTAPVYHTSEEEVLQHAIGHLEGSSLPVGGEGTHAVLTGHRGLPSAKLFTDLDKLVVGDAFTIDVLGRTLTYEVDQIRIVLPDDFTNLGIEEGKDYVTLSTCTPYGINTHRLLVRGHRIENKPGKVHVTADAVQIDNRHVAIAIAVPLMLIAVFVMTKGSSMKRKRRMRKKKRTGIRPGGSLKKPDGPAETEDTEDIEDRSDREG